MPAALLLCLLAACGAPAPPRGAIATNDQAETARLAEAGDPAAQTVLGNLYETGAFGAPDYGRAAAWYAEAADQGDPLAAYFLGNLYERGLGVARDYGRAARLYQAAAEAGHPSAAFKLGYFHEKGLGVARDFTAARQWYDIAEQGWGSGRVLPMQPDYLVIAAPATGAPAQAVTLVPVASLAGLPVLPETQVADADSRAGAAPAPPEPGFYLHLASQRAPDAALHAWEAAREHHADLLDGLTVVLARLDLGLAGDYYQVLAGPIALEEDADIICARLQPQGQYCDPLPLMN